MWLMDKIIGSDLSLKRPDFEAAPTQTLDFSGNKLIFKDPPHTAMFPIHNWPTDLDIYDRDAFSINDSSGYSKEFYVKGCDLFGMLNKPKGGIIVSGMIEYHPDSSSLFEKNNFIDVLLSYSHELWGFQNGSNAIGDPGDGTFKYPHNESHFKEKIINEIKWYEFSCYKDGKPPRIEFACPISKSHVLILDFKISTYQSIDFYSPKTNIEQASFKVIDEFMINFKIELSDKSKLQKRESKDPA